MNSTHRSTGLIVLWALCLCACSFPRTPSAVATTTAATSTANVASHPAPQAPFDETPITPAESAGAASSD